MISLSNITKKEKDEARKQNFEIFEISKDQNLTKEGRSLILAEKKSQMISKETLLRAGLSISTNTALDFVVFKVGCATKLYQRNLKSLEKDCLEDIQEKMESLLETDPDNLEDLKSLEEEQEAILIHICKARNLQDPPR
jgi:CRISPR/Cas system CMR-associated protein Cmr1 (group 7 of RAMP superfamily)